MAAAFAIGARQYDEVGKPGAMGNKAVHSNHLRGQSRYGPVQFNILKLFAGCSLKRLRLIACLRASG